MRVTAFPQHHLLDAQLARGFGVLDGDACELCIVVPESVVNGVIARDFGGERPADSGRVRNQSKGAGLPYELLFASIAAIPWAIALAAGWYALGTVTRGFRLPMFVAAISDTAFTAT